MHFITAVIFFFLVGKTIAQHADTAVINAKNKHAFDIHDTDSDSALQMCRGLLKISRELAYLKGQGDACVTIGAIYRNLDNFTESDRYFYEAIKVRRIIGDSNRVAAVFINLGINFFQKSRYDSAITNVLYAITILEAESQPDKILLGSAYLLLSNIFDEYLEPEEAVRYARKSLDAYIVTNKNEHIGRAAYSLGNRFLENNSLDSSLHYYNLAYNNFLSSSKDPDYIANILTNKGIVYTKKSEFALAADYYRQAEETLAQLGEDADYFHLYLNKADWFIRQNLLQQGLEYLKKAQASDTGTMNDLDKKYLYEDLAKTYAGLNRHDSAYFYQSEAYIVRDSIYNENKRKQFIRLQAERYKTESTQQTAIAQQQTARARQLLLTTFLLAMIAFILVVAYIQRRKSFRIISQQRESLHRQAVDELIQASELKFLNAGMEGGEMARESISREIHDRLGSAMVTLSWQYDAVLENIPPGSPDRRHMEKLNAALKNLYHDIRHIAHQLGSGVLERVGLVPVLEELCDDIATANKMEVDFSCYGLDERLSFFQEINILRIIQELVSNTLKYAEATQLSVQINRIDNVLNIMVEDNGHGFDPVNIRGHGIGFSNVENRIRNLNGTIQVESQPGTGASIILNIPVIQSEMPTSSHDQTH